jgi:hypothetical protein
MYNPLEVAKAVEAIVIEKRGSLCSLSAALGISHMTVQRLKTGKGYNRAVIVPHSNPIKPLLEEVHQSARVYYARSKLDLHIGFYDGFYQSVHIDEKCFFITQEQLYLYLLSVEIEEGRVLVRRVPHKSHIIKVTFLADTARPRYDAQGTCVFDGKIGIWPIVAQEEARRDSVNRPAGTIVTKPVNMDRNLYRDISCLSTSPFLPLKPDFPDAIKMW